MITPSRLNHILGVARKAKSLALQLKPNNLKYAEDMFLLGFLHDIGYEFLSSNTEHAMIGGEILKRAGYQYWQEVSLHGDASQQNMNDELFILNCADMSTGPNGEDFTFEQRLDEIATRFGEQSNAHRKCVIEIQKLRSDKRSLILSVTR